MIYCEKHLKQQKTENYYILFQIFLIEVQTPGSVSIKPSACFLQQAVQTHSFETSRSLAGCGSLLMIGSLVCGKLTKSLSFRLLPKHTDDQFLYKDQKNMKASRKEHMSCTVVTYSRHVSQHPPQCEINVRQETRAQTHRQQLGSHEYVLLNCCTHPHPRFVGALTCK